jgi:hypothetical protein
MVVIVGTDIAEYTDDNGIRYTFLLVFLAKLHLLLEAQSLDNHNTNLS